MCILVDFSTSDSLPHSLARGIQHTAVRQAHRKYEPNFHDKYGNLVLLGGAAVFTAIWGYVSHPFFHCFFVTLAVNLQAIAFHKGFLV